MPVGTKHYIGDTNFLGIEVYWSLDSRHYFIIWKFKDHTESYYWDYNKNPDDAYWEKIYPKEENFMELLEILCQKEETLEGNWEMISFSFVKWNEDSDAMCFSFETDDAQSGFLWYSIQTDTIVQILTE